MGLLHMNLVGVEAKNLLRVAHIVVKKFCLDWVGKGGMGTSEGDQVVDNSVKPLDVDFVPTQDDVEMVDNPMNHQDVVIEEELNGESVYINMEACVG